MTGAAREDHAGLAGRARRHARTLAATALSRSGLDRRGADPRRVVIGYHQVVDRVPAADDAVRLPSSVVSLRTLEQQIDWLGRHYRFVPLDELDAPPRRDRRPVAAVTFDDGYEDFHRHAFDLLRRKGVPAAMFVVTDVVGTKSLLPHDHVHLLVRRALRRWTAPVPELQRVLTEVDHPTPAPFHRPATGRDAVPLTRWLLGAVRRAALGRLIARLESRLDVALEAPPPLRALSWPQVIELHRAGITIGSHTASHALLPLESDATVAAELRRSRKVLEARLGAPVRDLAYPDGRFTSRVVEAASEAGYTRAFTTCRHLDARHPWLTVPRTLLWERSSSDDCGDLVPQLLDCQVRGLLPLWPSCRRAAHA